MLKVIDASRVSRPLPAYLATAAPVAFGPGFYDEERDEDGAFRWMGETGRLDFAPAAEERWLELEVYSEFHDLSQRLAAAVAGVPAAEPAPIELRHGWNRLSLPVPAGAPGVEMAASRLYPPVYYPGDWRRLSVRLRPPRLHADPERHRHLAAPHANAIANLRETLAGRAVLDSTPPVLGIDMFGVCNVKPPCVYCEWDTSKRAEGENVDRPFGGETLAAWGRLFDAAGHLVNCSIGEPFMMKDLDQLLDLFGDRGKSLEMTTNGQILTERNVSRLLGRRIELYVSLDAATPETYAKLRNDRFDRILVNLRRLIAAKGGRQGLPRVYLVFMPMRVNVGELEGFVRLCADLEVDRMILRPLNYSETIDLEWERGGHHFVYHQQLLPFDELIEASGRARGWCERYGVPLADQLDFGESVRTMFAERFETARRAALAGCGAGERQAAAEPPAAPASPSATPAAAPAQEPAAPAEAAPGEPRPSLGAERLPLCQEPWKSLYILRRGIYPCCYGGQPIAGMDDHAAAWSSLAMQEIRRELAAGRFARYCRESPACPIVRKAVADAPPAPARRLRRAWRRLDRGLGGVPGRLLAPVKPLLRPLLGLPAEPGPAAR